MKKWNLKMRKSLQAYLKEDLLLKTIFEEFKALGGDYGKLTYRDITREVKNGLTEAQIKNRQYAKYDIVRSYMNILGDDAVDYIKTHEVGIEGKY